MKVKGLRWLGVGTERVLQMRSFAIDVLGMKVDGLPGGYAWQHFRAPDGNVYELTADPGADR